MMSGQARKLQAARCPFVDNENRDKRRGVESFDV